MGPLVNMTDLRQDEQNPFAPPIDLEQVRFDPSALTADQIRSLAAVRDGLLHSLVGITGFYVLGTLVSFVVPSVKQHGVYVQGAVFFGGIAGMLAFQLEAWVGIIRLRSAPRESRSHNLALVAIALQAPQFVLLLTTVLLLTLSQPLQPIATMGVPCQRVHAASLLCVLALAQRIARYLQHSEAARVAQFGFWAALGSGACAFLGFELAYANGGTPPLLSRALLGLSIGGWASAFMASVVAVHRIRAATRISKLAEQV